MSAASALIEMSAARGGATPRNRQEHFDVLPADPLTASFDECVSRSADQLERVALRWRRGSSTECDEKELELRSQGRTITPMKGKSELRCSSARASPTASTLLTGSSVSSPWRCPVSESKFKLPDKETQLCTEKRLLRL